MSKSKGKSKVLEEVKKKHVMISYNWANSSEVKEIASILEPYIYVWRDKKNLAGAKDLWTEIANAISKSEFVVAIITPEYEKSDSCTNELNYALNINIPVVPVFIDPNFRPKGNVGLRTSKLYFIITSDIIRNPLLFVKHLYAMSTNASHYDAHPYLATWLKYTIDEIEVMIDLKYRNNKSLDSNASNDLNNNESVKTNNVVVKKEEKQRAPPTLGLLSDSETDSNNNNSLNVYCMDTNKSAQKVTELDEPYKLGEFMVKNDSKKKRENQENVKKIENEFINLLLNKKESDKEIDQNKSASNNLDPNQENEENQKRSRSLDSNSRHSFHIHQNKPDRSEYDLYTRDRDDLMSFVCHGKEADIEDADYQEIYETKPKINDNQIFLELIISINQGYICCFALIKEDLLLIANEKAEFQLLRPMKEKWDFLRFSLNPKFNGNDGELYKSGKKILIDMCFDSKGNLILLNRWKVKDESNSENSLNSENNSENESKFKYTIELYSFNSKASDTIVYLKTICSISNISIFSSTPNPNSLSPNVASNIQNVSKISYSNKPSDGTLNSPPVFTRVYNDEKNNSFVLIDSANSKIYWFKKTSGAKRRCLKSQDNSLKDPKSIAFSYDDKDNETIFISSKAGLLVLNKNYTIKHDTLKRLEDIYYDVFEKCLLFTDSRNLFGGRIRPKKI